jgi:hypothetical protein
MTNLEKLLLVYQSNISMLCPDNVKETTALLSHGGRTEQGLFHFLKPFIRVWKHSTHEDSHKIIVSVVSACHNK